MSWWAWRIVGTDVALVRRRLVVRLRGVMALELLVPVGTVLKLPWFDR